MMKILSKLDDIYIAWCKKNDIKEIISADEQIYQDNMSYEQNSWLDKFIVNYDRAQELEYFIEKNINKEGQ